MHFSVVLVFVLLPLLAQEAGIRERFAGVWEAKWKDEVICTIRLRQGTPISGETEACRISVDSNGDLQQPPPFDGPSTPAPIRNVKLEGGTLEFDEQDGDDVMRFQLKITGDATAHLTFPNAPARINPVLFTRR